MLLPLWALRRIPTAPPKATRGWVTVKGILSPWVPLTLLWLEMAYPGAAWLTSAFDMLPFQCRHWSLVLFLQYNQALFQAYGLPSSVSHGWNRKQRVKRKCSTPPQITSPTTRPVSQTPLQPPSPSKTATPLPPMPSPDQKGTSTAQKLSCTTIERPGQLPIPP